MKKRGGGGVAEVAGTFKQCPNSSCISFFSVMTSLPSFPSQSLLFHCDLPPSLQPSPQDGKVSPKKVHFSEIDQIKLMSQV